LHQKVGADLGTGQGWSANTLYFGFTTNLGLIKEDLCKHAIGRGHRPLPAAHYLCIGKWWLLRPKAI